MKCPIDGDTLAIAYRDGIEIDYCPTCRGVWLDRGELDKLIERAAAPAEAPQQTYEDPGAHAPYEERRERAPRPDKRKRKKGLLGEIFDFLD